MSMNWRVQRGAARRDEEERVNFPEIENSSSSRLSLEKGMVDWTRLPDDTVIQIFSRLNYCDRASLSSTCRSWRFLGKSPYLWQELDLRHHKCDTAAATSLASRCDNLQRLSFCGLDSANAIINLRARNLREIRGDCCKKISDATLSILVARHEALECLQIGPDFCSRISNDAVKAIAICCPQLKKLRLSGVHEVDANAINALAQHCQYLTDIGFIDCRKVDETALGNVASVRLLSVAGTTNIKWKSVLRQWSKLPQLTGLDVSRTDIYPNTISRLFSSSHSMKVLCALNCPELEEDTPFISNKNHKGKVLLAFFKDIIKGVASLFVDTRDCEKNVFLDQKKSKIKDGKLDELVNWLEWILSHLLLHFSGCTLRALDNFWLNQGKTLLLSFMQSAPEEVQGRAARALATSVVIDLENDSIDTGRAEAVIRDGGTCLLLNLARSLPEVLQSEAVKAISALSVNANVAKAVAVQGGISILADLARSMNRVVVKAAAGGLCNLSVGEEHKGAIVKASGVKVLVGLISKWLSYPGGEGVLVHTTDFEIQFPNSIGEFMKCAAGALANLGEHCKCSVEVVSGGGLPALVMLARSCKVIGV